MIEFMRAQEQLLLRLASFGDKMSKKLESRYNGRKGGYKTVSNEELAEKARGGDHEAMMSLWYQVERLVHKNAARWAAYGSGGVTVADLRQSGFIAMMRAVENFDPGRGKFTTHLGTYLLAEFSLATNQQSARTRRDPLHSAVSLDMPLGEEEDFRLRDILPDLTAEGEILDVDEQDWHEHLSASMEEALATLTEGERRAIYGRYYQGLTVNAIAAAEGTNRAVVLRWMQQGMSRLRRPACAKTLRKYL